ncbi:MAG TPA: TetR/AcrR family transcriptional regulator [Solirubrobacterales bacterium]|nr:TetR/AcrR family transcriptional regulator [Solirubrobacterales bacterium]
MGVPAIRYGVFFSPRSELPRGRHALDRDEAIEVQRERLMAAFAELVADRGLADVTVTDVVAHTSVSRAAFYSCFDDLAGCGDAAYDRFIAVLLERLGTALNPADHWQTFVDSAVRAYLETLQSDPVVARAMQIEMDAAGKAARVRRRHALKTIADVIRSRHATLLVEDPSMGSLPDEAHLGFVYAVRQLACDALEDDPEPDLLALIDPAVHWIRASVYGAAHEDARTSLQS